MVATLFSEYNTCVESARIVQLTATKPKVKLSLGVGEVKTEYIAKEQGNLQKFDNDRKNDNGKH